MVAQIDWALVERRADLQGFIQASSKVAASLAFDLLFRSVVHEKPKVFQRRAVTLERIGESKVPSHPEGKSLNSCILSFVPGKRAAFIHYDQALDGSNDGNTQRMV